MNKTNINYNNSFFIIIKKCVYFDGLSVELLILTNQYAKLIKVLSDFFISVDFTSIRINYNVENLI